LSFIAQLVPRLADCRFSPPYYATEQLVEGTLAAIGAALERASDDELCLIASYDDRDAGFLWADTKRDYFTGESHGYIEELAVAVEGFGIGSRLIEHAEAWSRERGHRYVSLSVRPKNERAKRLYDRHGYGVDVEVRLKLL
jgi:ribosomal protein S18 acetylase RimI-like enzyme